MTRAQLLEYVTNTVQKQDADDHQRIDSCLEGSEILSRRDFMLLWYGSVLPEKYSDEQLQLVVDALGITADGDDGEDVKKMFMSERSVLGSKQLFDDIASFEKRLGMDIGLMDRKMVLDIFSGIGIYSIGTLKRRLVALNRYIDWRKEKNYPVSDFWQNKSVSIYEIDITKAIRDRCIKDEYALKDKIVNSVDTKSGYMGPVVLCLAWAGFSPREMAAIKIEEVDSGANTVKGHKLPSVLFDIVYDYLKTEEVYRSNRQGENVRRYVLEDTGYLLRNAVNKPRIDAKMVSEGAIAQAAMAIRGATINDVTFSGHCSRLWEKDKMMRVTKKDFIEEFDMIAGTASFDVRASDKMMEFDAFKRAFYY